MYLTSLIILVASFTRFDAVVADAQARQVQKELRKRHLFYGTDDGKLTPALIAAIKRYQEKKGFPPTGLLDAETLASLGFVRPPPPAEGEVIVITRQERELRGPNGERLPSSVPLNTAQLENTFVLEPESKPAQEFAGPKLGVSQQPVPLARRRSHGTRRIRSGKETNPIVLAYRTADRAMRNLFGQPRSVRKKAAARRL